MSSGAGRGRGGDRRGGDRNGDRRYGRDRFDFFSKFTLFVILL